MSRIPQPTSRLPVKTSSSIPSLSSTRSSGLVPPTRRLPTAESTADVGSSTLTSSASIREFANNATLSATSSGLRKPTENSRLLTSTHRSSAGGISAGPTSASLDSTSSLASSRVSALSTTRKTTALPLSKTSTRPLSSSVDSDNSSINSAGSAGSAGFLSSTRTSAVQRTARTTTDSLRASTTSLPSSSAAHSSTRTANMSSTAAQRASNAPIASSSSSSTRLAADSHALHKIPGASREKVSILGGRPTGSTLQSTSSDALPVPVTKNDPSFPPVPPTVRATAVEKKEYTQEELDQLPLPTYLQIVGQGADSAQPTTRSLKDMSRDEVLAEMMKLCDPLIAAQQGSVFDPTLDEFLVDADYVTRSMTVSAVFRAFHKLDVMDNLAAVHDMLFEGKTLLDADFDADIRKIMEDEKVFS